MCEISATFSEILTGNTCPKILKKIVVYKKIRIKTLLTDEEKTREEKKERGGKRNERQDKTKERKNRGEEGRKD